MVMYLSFRDQYSLCMYLYCFKETIIPKAFKCHLLKRNFLICPKQFYSSLGLLLFSQFRTLDYFSTILSHACMPQMKITVLGTLLSSSVLCIHILDIYRIKVKRSEFMPVVRRLIQCHTQHQCILNPMVRWNPKRFISRNSLFFLPVPLSPPPPPSLCLLQSLGIANLNKFQK